MTLRCFQCGERFHSKTEKDINEVSNYHTHTPNISNPNIGVDYSQ